MNDDYPADDACRIPADGSFRIDSAAQQPPADFNSRQIRALFKAGISGLDDLQRRFYAQNSHALLLIFQGMDAAGKDGTIRAVLREVDPAGCQVKSFKQPSSLELKHDFLWRTMSHLPERGHIGVFNRSYYEEVLIARVHPELLAAQKLPPLADPADRWQQRYESICEHEHHLARNGTLILKFFLNISATEQRRRFLKRLEQPEKHWKFSAQDVAERGYWQDYMHAYEQALNATSRPWAPWYAVPADDKTYMRYKVADIVTRTLQRLDPRYPTPEPALLEQLQAARRTLKNE
ncbi:PPK2 family polyphosphate:nucleotide phosphotransferase [Methylohalomonas lacus]|uniref:PPK2 family polyphosphate:nucleotide phosphotransferase n=1 Tax=Methylohalomonas lacus TaxID=398773 RepID=A0AAE3HMY4_9GAMM|nr:PPK2 family polyphosphate kinase [Methylohalomonas lacus]MCS3903433.1 PPK2 family polyphosphate:nucleotide phosphotransferase [Methylohalomonas lacus]